MTKDEFSFDVWFENMTSMVLDKCGVVFRDEDAVRFDYEEGKNCADVADEIAAEYSDGDV